MKPTHNFTEDSLRKSTPEMRAIADALARGDDVHPHNMDYFGFPSTTGEEGSDSSKNVDETNVAKGAVRFAQQTKRFPRA